MQCYELVDGACRDRDRVSVRYLRGYAVLQVGQVVACEALAFQSAICADMQ